MKSIEVRVYIYAFCDHHWVGNEEDEDNEATAKGLSGVHRNPCFYHDDSRVCCHSTECHYH